MSVKCERFYICEFRTVYILVKALRSHSCQSDKELSISPTIHFLKRIPVQRIVGVSGVQHSRKK